MKKDNNEKINFFTKNLFFRSSVFLVIAVFLLSACSQTKQEQGTGLVGQGSSVSQENSNPSSASNIPTSAASPDGGLVAEKSNGHGKVILTAGPEVAAKAKKDYEERAKKGQYYD